ncbi:MAG: hypothetical protein GY801_52305 [bacterium]|nr:hypothetical protein [bacterium]
MSTETSQTVLTGQENSLICRITQESKKATAQETTLQSLIESLVEEYNFEPEDMARDVKLVYEDLETNKKKRIPANLVIHEEGQDHEQQNIIRICSVQPEKTKHTDSCKGVGLLHDAQGTISGDENPENPFVFTNPPFGSKIPIDEPKILEQFDLSYRWKKDEDGRWRKSYQETLLAEHEQPEYGVFMAITEKVGKDCRGNRIFVRDDDGAELKFLTIRESLRKLSDGERIVTEHEEYQPRVDDDLPRILGKWQEFLQG